MSLTKNEKALGLIAGVAFIVAIALTFLMGVPAHANVASQTALSTATTSAAFSVTTSARILATTTNALGNGTSYTRIFASICTTSSNPVALNLDIDKPANGPAGSVTAYIAAAAGYQACYEITDRNAYSGAVTASSTNQTATLVTVKDYVQ